MACQLPNVSDSGLMALKPLEVTGVILKEKKLGKGSNATVEEVLWEGTFCAAKILHTILLDDDNPGGSQRFIEGFVKECLTWSKLSHPHVVQFLGVYFKPQSRSPILLLEKMDISLNAFLEENQREDLLLPDKIFILLQVVQGLAYLHSRKPALVHHDLSPNNILLNRVLLLAKLTDFGMSRAVDPSGGSRKSSVKGTMAFMSPEALTNPPKYDEKLDVFSFGNVIITTMTHAWPIPATATEYEGDKLVALTEFKRREQHVRQFTEEESTIFGDIIRSCLDNRPTKRPTSLQLVGQMRWIEEDHPRKKLTEGPAMIEQLHTQLQQKDTELQEKDTELQRKDRLLTENARQLQEKDDQLQAKERQLQENVKQLKLKGTLVFRSDLVRPDELRSIEMPHLLIPTFGATPVTIDREVYLTGGRAFTASKAKLVQVYNTDTRECRTLPQSLQCNSQAVAIDGNLVLIGGKNSSTLKPTNMVSTWLTAEERWTQVLPPMKMKRWRPGILLLNNHLFVFGGKGEDGKTRFDSFEVLDLSAKQPEWREGRGSLPKPLSLPQLGVFKTYIMLYGGFPSAEEVVNTCYTAPVQGLVDSVTNSSSPPIHWTQVQSAPHYFSTLLTTSQDAVLIGGESIDDKVTRAIHRFSSSGSWEVIGELSEPRVEAAAVAVSSRSFLVFGGNSNPSKDPLSSQLESVELVTYCKKVTP